MDRPTSSIFPVIWRKILFWAFAVFLGILIGYLWATNITMFKYLVILAVVGFFTTRSVKISLGLFIFSLPFVGFGALPMMPSIKVSYVMFVLLLISVIMNKEKEKSIKRINEKYKEIGERVKTIIDLPLFIFLTIIVISIFQSRYVPANPYIINQSIINFPWLKSISKIVLLFGCIAIYYLSVYLLNKKEKINDALNVHIFSGTVLSLFGIACLFLFLYNGNILTLGGYNTIVTAVGNLPRILSVEQEPLFFGFYLLTILPILYIIVINQYSKNKKNKSTTNNNIANSNNDSNNDRNYLYYGFIFAAVVMTSALLLTQSRSALLGFIGSLTALFFLFKDDRPYYQYTKDYFTEIYRISRQLLKWMTSSKIKVVLCLLLLTMISYQGVIHYETIEVKVIYGIEIGLINPIVGAFDSSRGKYWSTKTRLIMYQFAIDVFNEHPILGVGYENYNFYSGHQFYWGLYDANVNWPEVNNYPLKVLAELGILGFTAFILLIITTFYSLFTAIKKTTDEFFRSILKGYTASFIGIAILLLFSSNITKPYLWVSLAMAMATVKLVNKEQKQYFKKETVLKG